MTDEDTPTPTPASQRDGIAEGRQRLRAADRRDDDGGDEHRRGEAVDAAQRRVACATRSASTM